MNNLKKQVQERIGALIKKLDFLKNQDYRTFKERKKCIDEQESTEKEIAQLRKFLPLQVNSWVRKGDHTGKITELKLTPGGLPEVWIHWWNYRVSVPEHRIDRLIILSDTRVDLEELNCVETQEDKVDSNEEISLNHKTWNPSWTTDIEVKKVQTYTGQVALPNQQLEFLPSFKTVEEAEKTAQQVFNQKDGLDWRVYLVTTNIYYPLIRDEFGNVITRLSGYNTEEMAKAIGEDELLRLKLQTNPNSTPNLTPKTQKIISSGEIFGYRYEVKEINTGEYQGTVYDNKSLNTLTTPILQNLFFTEFECKKLAIYLFATEKKKEMGKRSLEKMTIKDFKEKIKEVLNHLPIKPKEIKRWLESKNLSALVTEPDGRKKDFWKQSYLAICNPA